MGTASPYIRLLFLFFFVAFLQACSSNTIFSEKELVDSPTEINPKATTILEGTLEEGRFNPAFFRDSNNLKNAALVKQIYTQNNYKLLWSLNGRFNPETDSLARLIKSAWSHGLFPADYYQQQLAGVRNELQKSMLAGARPDASRWTYFDMLSTSAFIQLVKDIKVGRLQADSLVARDSTLNAAFFLQQKDSFAKLPASAFAKNLEPALKDYHRLKQALQRFLPKANLKKFAQVKTNDSLLLPKLIYKRIAEEDSLKLKAVKDPDSLAISKAIARYQKWKKLKVDGKVTKKLVEQLNDTDLEKFARVAITLDKYKLLASLPDEYLLVNLPSYYLEVRKGDSVLLRSKIICGKSVTKTPQLTSAITDMITYPQWTIPESIIKKEILPALQRDAGYLGRKGYSLIDHKGNEVSPYSVRWSKYKNVIPYKVVQGSGDANALGVLKFNFANAYAVYLHDTNQRYLFGKSSRSMSHGCVRVQQWRELAYYILRRDRVADSVKAVPVDSLDSWLAKKKKRYIKVQQPLPLYIRYFSVEGKDGKLVWHEDIYEEDKRFRETIFARK